MLGLFEKILRELRLLVLNRVEKTDAPNRMYGTDASGNQKLYGIDSFGQRIVKYELTGQMDGAKQTFDIDPNIKSGMATLLRYGLLTFDEGDYVINASAHTLTTLFDKPPDGLNGRRLILVVNGDDSLGGSIITPAGVGIDGFNPDNFKDLVDKWKLEGYWT